MTSRVNCSVSRATSLLKLFELLQQQKHVDRGKQMYMPKVSIIIPAYNTEFYIKEAVKSALEQTVSNIEVIVVDDGSSDSTVSVIEAIRDDRLKLLVNDRNLGVSGARNRALSEARGEWIAVLDSDDWFSVERLEKLLCIASSENADIVADDLNLIRDGEFIPWTTLLCQGKAEFSSPINIDSVSFVESDIYGKPGLHYGFLKPIFRKKFLDENMIRYNPDLPCSEDFWLLLECLINGAKLCLTPEPYYYYRSRSSSLIRQSSLKRLETELATTYLFLDKEAVANNFDLVRALINKAQVLTVYRNYYSVIEPLKQKDFQAAMIAVIRYPSFLIHLISRVPGIIYRRLRRAILGKGLWEGIN